MPAPLEMLLRAITSGNQVLSPEMYAHFGGDDILKQVQQYDPNAKWVDSDIGGGEGGSQGVGKRLEFDNTKLPTSKKGTIGYDLRPANLLTAKPGSQALQDDVYGSVRNSSEMYAKAGTLDRLAPYIAAMIAAGGPMVGGMLAGAGIGGAAGFTSAVTGGAAGLPAGAIPGAMGGVGAGAAGSSTWSRLLTRAPGTLNRMNSGSGSWMDLLGLAAPASGVPGASYLPALLRLLGK